MANQISAAVGRRLARFLEKPVSGYIAFAVTSAPLLREALRPGDVLLVEGDTRVSGAIKFLTQSTWSHAAFCAGRDGDDHELIEADLSEGVRSVSIETYEMLNTRICRPVSLSPDDLATVVNYMKSSIGKTYDLKNIVDLVRYLLPHPPVPQRWRRRMLALGSGDPTRAICSTLIAEAFQQVRYPILPIIEDDCPAKCAEEMLTIRHHSLFVPRDFDLSPYFRIVKPTIESGFDYTHLHWSDRPPPDGIAAPECPAPVAPSSFPKYPRG
jgi:hypothetical protein